MSGEARKQLALADAARLEGNARVQAGAWEEALLSYDKAR